MQQLFNLMMHLSVRPAKPSTMSNEAEVGRLEGVYAGLTAEKRTLRKRERLEKMVWRYGKACCFS